VITAAKQFGTRGFGVDYDPRLVKLATDNARRAGVSERVTFIEQNLFKTDISQATVVTMYLLPEYNEALHPKLLPYRQAAPARNQDRSHQACRAADTRYSGPARASSVADTDEMVFAVGGKFKAGTNILLFQFRKVAHDFLLRHARGQPPQHVIDGDSHGTNTRSAASLPRLDSNAGTIIHTYPYSGQQQV
jgi:hypothetical protein